MRYFRCLCIVVFCAISIVPVRAGIYLDINGQGGPTYPGYSALDAGTNSASGSTTTDGVTISYIGASGSRDRGTDRFAQPGTDPAIVALTDLLRDFIYVADGAGTMTLSITGLSAGTHEITSYHMEAYPTSAEVGASYAVTDETGTHYFTIIDASADRIDDDSPTVGLLSDISRSYYVNSNGIDPIMLACVGAAARINGIVIGSGPVLLAGDANRDNVVSAGDYASVQANFGSTGIPGILGDANGDGVVSAGDYASVQANFGNTLPTSVTPEPATLSLLSLGGLAMIRRRK
jgi:hypothetical protein